MSTTHGPWAPASLASLERVAQRFASAPFRWWVSGGLALELWTGCSWRAHGDIDLGILRADFPRVAAWLGDHALFVASGGQLSPFHGQLLSSAAHQNNVWVRERGANVWLFDLQLGDGDDESWFYRRDHAIQRLWSTAVLTTESGIPYLAPDLQLLFKSKNPRDKDTQDASEIIPRLVSDQRAFLLATLPREHPWLGLLTA